MTMKFYEDQIGDLLNPIVTSDEMWKDYEDYLQNAIENKQPYLTYGAYVQDLIDSGEFREVHLSYEEIENLLTEEQNRITLETYPPYELDNYTYDHSLRVFTVPYSWYLKWLEENYFIPESTNRDADDYFQVECTWDDTLLMYNMALEDHVLIWEELRPR